MWASFVRRRGSFIVSLITVFAFRAEAADNWQVPEAYLRYELKLSGSATRPSAGFLAQLPDGGILHNRAPFTVVMTPQGKELPSYLLWENSQSGFSLVFASPAIDTESVYVYVRNDRPAQSWTPQTGITPSAILCTNPGRDRMDAAHALGKLGHVDAAAHVMNKAGIPRAPLSIGGDETGRPRPAVFYLLSYVDAAKDGKYWIAPFSPEGGTEVQIDGKVLVPTKRNDKWGGKGAEFDLSQGLHRLEVFQLGTGSGPYVTEQSRSGLMYLAWRTPDDKPNDKNETRIIKDSEIARSGNCEVTGIESRDGSPVACASIQPSLTYCFENEEPLILYDCKALTGSNPADTVYSWTFADKGVVDSKELQWFLPGLKDSQIKLVAKSGNKISENAVPLFAFGTKSASLDDPEHRALFRSSMNRMLESYPTSSDPVGDWTNGYWNNLIRNMEYGEGAPLLRQLLGPRWNSTRRKLSSQQISFLQDILLAIEQRDNPQEELKWLAKFQESTTEYARKNDLKIQEAELKMFLLQDRDGARQILSLIEPANDLSGEKARVRLGDLALIEGDLNKATSYYADVQNRARSRRNSSKTVTGSVVTQQLVEAGQSNSLGSKSSPNPFSQSNSAREKSAALQDVSFSENVKSLLGQGYFSEARQTLQNWESEFPLSKINGDFIICEAEFYTKTKNWKRAQPMLEAYCRQIDASSFVPDATALLITCVRETKGSPESVREVLEKVKARLKYHPVAKDLEDFLSGNSKTEP